MWHLWVWQYIVIQVTRRIKRPLRALMVKNICSMGLQKGHKINVKILDKMGNDKYSSWQNMLSGKEYIL